MPKIDPNKFEQEFLMHQPEQPKSSAQISSASKKANEQYLYHAADEVPAFHFLNKQHIAADDGSSSFEMHDRILQALKNLVDPKSPLSNHLTDYGSHVLTETSLKKVGGYLIDIGLSDAKQLFQANPIDQTDLNVLTPVLAHGTSQLFSGILRGLDLQPHDYILELTPGYGLFNNIIVEHKVKVESQSIYDIKNQKVDLDGFRKKLSELNHEIKEHYSRYFKIRLNNLKQSDEYQTLSSKEKNEIDKEINKINNLKNIEEPIKKYNKIILKNFSVFGEEFLENILLKSYPKIKAIYHINPMMPLGIVLTQDDINSIAKIVSEVSPNTLLIDDLSYHNLVLPDIKKQPGVFTKTPLKNQSVSLIGFSKDWSMAGVRVGLAIANPSIAIKLLKYVSNEITMPSIFAKEACDAVVSIPKKEREKHLKECTKEYQFRRDLCIAFINGIKSVSNAEQKVEIQKHLENLKLKKETIEGLLNGIPGLDIVVKPESGYFICIDFSQLKGTKLGNITLNSAMDFRTLLNCYAGINTISGEMCLDFENTFLRFSYNLTPEEIVEAFIRINMLLSELRPDLVKSFKISKTKSDDSKPATTKNLLNKRKREPESVADSQNSKPKIDPNQLLEPRSTSTITSQFMLSKEKTVTNEGRSKRKITPNRRYQLSTN